MAVESEQAAAPSPGGGGSPAAGSKAPAKTPAWAVPAYVAGLVLVYLAQRVIVTLEHVSLVLSVIGALLALAATVVHFLPQYRGQGQRASIQKLFGVLGILGLLGLLVYSATTSSGEDLLGISQLGVKSRERAETLLLITWVTLIAVSVIPMLFAEVALASMRRAVHLEARRVQAAAAAGLALALAAGYCSLFVFAASETKARVDYSYFKTSEPGSSTRKMIESFTEPLEITAFFPEVSDVRTEVSGYLTELVKGVPNVELRMVDRYLEPKLAKDMKVFSDGTIVFGKGDTTRTLTIGADMQAARPKLKTLDKDVQEQLYKLLRSRRIAYLTVGHGELNAPSEDEKQKGRSADIVQEIIRGQNYQIRTLGLAQGLGREVPDDAEVVFVLGPTEPFAPEEVESLQRYADKGGKLFIALDADSIINEVPTGATEQAALPAGGAPVSRTVQGLQALAKVVGLEYSPTLLANDTQHVRRRANNSDRALLISNRFSSHASVSTLSRNAARAAIIFARTGSLSALNLPGYKVDMALKAMGGTFADLNQNYDFDKDSEKKDTYNLVAAVSKPVEGAEAPKADDKDKDAKKEPKEMRAFVLADADGMTDLLLSNFGPNRLLLMDAVRWLGGEDSFAGEVNDEQDVRIEHSKQGDQVWFYSTIVGVPALVLGAGLGISRRARRTSKAVTA
ncbi:MAG TPA: Gldg family protein [Polyangiaceae bacterium]|nr:Gldg family protein [Polyangiaceae bacterium]